MPIMYTTGSLTVVANTAFGSIAPRAAGRLVFQATPSAATVFCYRKTRAGVTVSGSFNSGVTVSGGQVAAFGLNIDPRATYAFHVRTSTVLRDVVVTEELLP